MTERFALALVAGLAVCGMDGSPRACGAIIAFALARCAYIWIRA